MIRIDGSAGEGGGQILRTALSLSAVTGKPFSLANIRAGRGNPGLQRQHLASVRAVAEVCGAKADGAGIGSSRLVFEPGKIPGGKFWAEGSGAEGFGAGGIAGGKFGEEGSGAVDFGAGGIAGGKFEVDVGSAGSVVLVAQAALPALFSAQHESELEIGGGTHVPGAPTYDYFENVFLPALGEFGLHAKSSMIRAGFYPKGGGEIVVRVKPGKPKAADFERALEGNEKIFAKIISSKLPSHVIEREKAEIERAFAGAAAEAKEVEASCPGNAVSVWSGFRGASALGKAGMPAERVAGEACDFLKKEIGAGAWADLHLADQLMPYLALSGGGELRVSEVSHHARTNAGIISLFLGARFNMREGLISVSSV